MKKGTLSLSVVGILLVTCLPACHQGIDMRSIDFNQLRIDQTLVAEIVLSEDQEIEPKMGDFSLNQMLLKDSYLPSAWVSDPPPRYYELKRIKRAQDRELLFYVVCFDDTQIAEIKVATLTGGALTYNYLIWTNVEYGAPYTLIQLGENAGQAQFYHEGELRFSYLFDEGKLGE